MLRNSSEFGSALPSVAELPIAKQTPKKEHQAKLQNPIEKAQLMWDLYKDIQTAWRDFARQNMEGGKAPRLRDLDNSVGQAFRATPKFQKLHSRLAELWADDEVKAAWREEMNKESEKWSAVNGSWEKYETIQAQTVELEQSRTELYQEQFEESGLPAATHRRTLSDDLVEVEIELEEMNTQSEAIFQSDSKLAAKILANRMEKWRTELNSPESFVWTKSRQEILQTLEKMIIERDSLRLIVLEGEAGTGKTTFAKELAQIFTGHEALSVKVGEKTKVDRALFTDQTLAAGSSPTVYKPLLYALTGKRGPNSEVEHSGLTAFIDELNSLTNDEARILATNLDGMPPRGQTGYHLLGANPDDLIQPNAIVIGAQNPAGGRFGGRTDFTPEVKRKMAIIPVEYFPQSGSNPELYELFLVCLQDNDGRIRAKKSELSPAYKTIKDMPNKTSEDKLEIGEDKGGALWRLAQMLHQSYENLAHRPNTLTQTNPEAWLAGRVLPPGDVFKWLTQYKTEVKKGTSLENFLATKFIAWLNSSFGSDSDAGDKQLYLELGKKFKFLPENEDELILSRYMTISPKFLTDREAAELSPRVPRPIIRETIPELPPAAEFATHIIDFTDESGREFKKIKIKLCPTNSPFRYHKLGQETPIYTVVGVIDKCVTHPEFVGHIILAEVGRPEKKLVIPSLNGFEKQTKQTEIFVPNALNPYHEALLAGGIAKGPDNPEKRDRTINLAEILKESIELYTNQNLPDWKSDVEKADFANLTPEKRGLMENLLVDGWEVMGVLPGKEAQRKNLKDGLVNISPLVIENGVEQAVVDGIIVWQQIFEEINRLNCDYTARLPKRPYLLLTSPTQKPDTDTLSKTTAQQTSQLSQMQTAFNQKYGSSVVQAMEIGEYPVLQNSFTKNTKKQIPVGKTLTTLDPLDRDTFTRFIGAGLSVGGVPGAGWDASDRRLKFGWSDVGANSWGGFRLSVRIEL